jgi:hypothetical protein
MLRVERTERLEGSRFVAWQLYGLLAGGSRERLEVWQFYGAVVSAAPNRRDEQNIALGHSREQPPATNRWSCHLVKRPARRSLPEFSDDGRSLAPLQAAGLTISPCSLGERSALGGRQDRFIPCSLAVSQGRRSAAGSLAKDRLCAASRPGELHTGDSTDRLDSGFDLG